MQHMLPSLAWPAVLLAAVAVGMQGVPDKLSPEMLGACVWGGEKEGAADLLVWASRYIIRRRVQWPCCHDLLV